MILSTENLAALVHHGEAVIRERFIIRRTLPALVIAQSDIVGVFREEWPAAACIPQQALAIGSHPP